MSAVVSVSLSFGLPPGGSICPDAPLAWSNGDDKNGYAITLCYGMNTTSLPGYAAALAPDYFNGWKRKEVKAASEKIYFIDAIGSVAEGGSPPYSARYFMPTWGEVYFAPDHSNIVCYRHQKGACALFYDGHAAWKHYSEVKYDPADPATFGNKRQWEPKTP